METANSASKKTTNTISKGNIREALHLLQPSATDKENLVTAGRMLRSTNKLIKETKTENVTPERTKSCCLLTTCLSDKSKKSTYQNKAVQTTQEEIKVEDLTSAAGPSENYWEVLAKKRREALDDALDELSILKEQMEELKEENERLKEDKIKYEEMLQETRALVEVLQDMIESDSNGINNSLEDSTY